MFSTAVKSRWIVPVLAAMVFVFAVPAFAQKNSQTIERPTWQGYHGVAIGATADQVREKLGKPKSEDAEGLFYMVSEVETAQFVLDTDGKVKAISVVFDADHLTPPTYQDVFGKSVVAEARPDGGLFKMIRYEDLGFWISFNRQSGEKAMVIVLIQKI